VYAHTREGSRVHRKRERGAPSSIKQVRRDGFPNFAELIEVGLKERSTHRDRASIEPRALSPDKFAVRLPSMAGRNPDQIRRRKRGGERWLIVVTKHNVGIVKEAEFDVLLEGAAHFLEAEGMKEIVVIQKGDERPLSGSDAIRGHCPQTPVPRDDPFTPPFLDFSRESVVGKVRHNDKFNGQSIWKFH